MILTSVERVYFQRPTEEPFGIEYIVEEEVKTMEDPYQRSYRVKDSKSIDCGWLADNCHLVVIKNKSLTTQLDISVGDASLFVPPQAACRFYTNTPELFSLSAVEEVSITVTIFPK